MTWRVRKADVDVFVADLWKDLRQFPVSTGPDAFGKHCFSAQQAALEAQVMVELARDLEPGAVPRVLDLQDATLIMEKVPGIRLFDLIRHLASVDDPELVSHAASVKRILLDRAQARLGLVQQSLVKMTVLEDAEPYPLGPKLDSMFRLFTRVLDIPDISYPWRDDLEGFTHYWTERCCIVPFRDATTKNMIVDLPGAPRDRYEDTEVAQRSYVASLVAGGDSEVWYTAPIVDIDFSSVVNTTAPEDDPLSLLCHEWTYRTLPVSPELLVAVGGIAGPDAERSAATAFVRYMRFGGRKLAYWLINSQGFRIRFAYDNPLFYFEEIPRLCEELSPGFTVRYPGLFALVAGIARAVRIATPRDRELVNVDYLRMYNVRGDYWQQSPLESQ